LPMQKVLLRPDPMFTVVSVYSVVSGDSQETRNCCVTRAIAAG
jgi:hypothetical protein